MPGYQDQMRWRTTPTSSGSTSADRSLEKLYFKPVIKDKILSMMTVDDIFYSLRHIDGIDESHIDSYKDALHANNINGKVLLHCNLDELKKVLQMNFGDWELFRVMVKVLRDQEYVAYEAAKGIHSELTQDMTTSPHVSFYLHHDELAGGPRRPVAKYARPGLENLQESSPDEKTSIMTQTTPHLEEVVIINNPQDAIRKAPDTDFRAAPRRDSVVRQVKMESEILQAYFPSTMACTVETSEEDLTDLSRQPPVRAVDDRFSSGSMLTGDSMIVIPDEIDYTNEIRDSTDMLPIDGMSSMVSVYDVETASETNTSLYDRLRSVSESDNPEPSQQAKPYDSESSSSSDDNERNNIRTSRTNSVLSSGSDVFTRVRNKILHLVSPTQGNGKIPYTITHNESGSSPVTSPRSLSGVNLVENSKEHGASAHSAFKKVLPFRSLSADSPSTERRVRSVSESCDTAGDLQRSSEPARKRLSKLLDKHLITDEVSGTRLPQRRNNVPMPEPEISSDVTSEEETVKGNDATIKY